MGKKVDTALISAIREAVDRVGSQAELARRTRISQGNIAKYIAGGIKIINDKTLQKLRPYLTLPADYDCSRPVGDNFIAALLAVSEDLGRDDLIALIDYAETLLARKNHAPVELTAEDEERLATWGIDLRRFGYGMELIINSRGLCWLYNGIEFHKRQGDTLDRELLWRLLNTETDPKNWRELRIRSLEIDVYNQQIYQLTFYLNGTPPKLYATYLVPGVNTLFELTQNNSAPFRLADDVVVSLVFSAEEIEILKAGKTLKIGGGNDER